MPIRFRPFVLFGAMLSLVACEGGSSPTDAGSDPAALESCDGSCATPSSRLTADDVRKVVAQAVVEAQARGQLATVAVVDRVGNVLGVFQMSGAARAFRIDSLPGDPAGPTGGLEDIVFPPPVLNNAALNGTPYAAIAKALTGAYLSSEGNAFSTRTASQIIQDHFNPGEAQQPAGPLFGVQFSQLACSDFTGVSGGAATTQGPLRSPLGLAGDAGGFPLYKAGTVVGGVGVIAGASGEQPLYSIDRTIIDRDADPEELIATAATFGFAAPVSRRADRITAGGKTLRFSDVDSGDLASNPTTATFAAIDAAGDFVAVPGYVSAEPVAPMAGTVFGQADSGIRADTEHYPGLDAFVFVDANNANRFPPASGNAPSADAALKADEVRALLRSALAVANRARAQIRIPLSSQARVTISVVDADGDVLAMARTRDAPVFGADVSLQKARTAAFLSSPGAATLLGSNVPDPVYFASPCQAGDNLAACLAARSRGNVTGYVSTLRGFLPDPSALSGAIALTSRAGGNMALPLYPDGIDGNPAGPFSRPAGQWSPFNIGVQLDVVNNGIIAHLAFAAGAVATDVSKAQGCFGVGDLGAGSVAKGRVLANGLQLFPGGVPIYRGNVLVGGIGVSGDGVDQDDMIAFLGVHESGVGVNNAPAEVRSDTLAPGGSRLRYVQCPQAPFVGSSEQNVCVGK